MEDRIVARGLTFDDVLLEPAYSEVMPNEVDVSSRLTRNVPLSIPVVTAGVGYANNRTHAPDEHVRLGDFLNAARQIARVLDGFATL